MYPVLKDVDRYDGGVWIDCFQSATMSGFTWYQLGTPDVFLTKIRVRMSNDSDAPQDVRIHACRVDALCFGPLLDVCGLLGSVGTFFIDLSLDIAELWLIGQYLCIPFHALGELFLAGADACCTASGALSVGLAVLERGITWDEISALILAHWPELAPLIDDPASYIWTLIGDLIPDLPDWLDDPVAYITEIVDGILPDIPDWLTDPVGWLAATLEENFPLLYYLVVDPIGEILYLIGQAFDLTPYEAQSGEFIVKALFERWFPELYLLWRELQLWSGLYEREGAVGVMGEARRRFYGLAERVLRFLWEGEWGEVAETIELWLTGVVTEAASPAIAGAMVTVIGTDLSAITDAEGRYTIRGEVVAAPSYSLKITRSGYSDTIVPGVIAIDGVPTTIAVFMGFIVTPPEANPAPRLRTNIEVYVTVVEQLAWTEAVLATKIGEPTEDFWAAQVAELTDWLTNACVAIGVLQAELLLYIGSAEMPAEYADLLDFQCV